MDSYFKFRTIVGLIGCIILFFFGIGFLIEAIKMKKSDFILYSLGAISLSIVGFLICVFVLKRKK